MDGWMDGWWIDGWMDGWMDMLAKFSLSLVFFFSIYLFRLCQALDVACGIFTCTCQILDCKQLTLSEAENKCSGYQVTKNLQEKFERKSDIVALCLLFGCPDLPSPFLPPALCPGGWPIWANSEFSLALAWDQREGGVCGQGIYPLVLSMPGHHRSPVSLTQGHSRCQEACLHAVSGLWKRLASPHPFMPSSGNMSSSRVPNHSFS